MWAPQQKSSNLEIDLGFCLIYILRKLTGKLSVQRSPICLRVIMDNLLLSLLIILDFFCLSNWWYDADAHPPSVWVPNYCALFNLWLHNLFLYHENCLCYYQLKLHWVSQEPYINWLALFINKNIPFWSGSIFPDGYCDLCNCHLRIFGYEELITRLKY